MGSEHSKTEALIGEGAPTIRGRCMCGDVRYEITGPMFDMLHCHCEELPAPQLGRFCDHFQYR